MESLCRKLRLPHSGLRKVNNQASEATRGLFLLGAFMCDELSPIKRFVVMLYSGTASGAVKASPGVAVTGLTVYGFTVETWVSVLTCVYIIVMILGGLPKVIELVLYLISFAKRKRPSTIVPVNQRDDRGAMIQAIAKAKGEKGES